MRLLLSTARFYALNSEYVLTSIKPRPLIRLHLPFTHTTCSSTAGVGMATDEAFCILESVIQGHHIYKQVWTPRLGQIDSAHIMWRPVDRAVMLYALNSDVRLLTRVYGTCGQCVCVCVCVCACVRACVHAHVCICAFECLNSLVVLQRVCGNLMKFTFINAE